MKQCKKCKLNKPTDCYVRVLKNKDGLHTMCKACRKQIDHNYYVSGSKRAGIEKRRKLMCEFINFVRSWYGCFYCDETDPCCLDFHHRDPTMKEMEISKMAVGSSMAKLKKELAKCDVVCANCHRKLHAGTLVV